MKSIGRRGLLAGGGAVLAGAGAFALLRPEAGNVATAGSFAATGDFAWVPPHGDRWIGAEDARVTVMEFASARALIVRVSTKGRGAR